MNFLYACLFDFNFKKVEWEIRSFFIFCINHELFFHLAVYHMFIGFVYMFFQTSMHNSYRNKLIFFFFFLSALAKIKRYNL